MTRTLQAGEVESLVLTINERLGKAGLARVDGKQIEVDVYGDVDDAELDWIKRMIGAMGEMEFRVLANSQREADGPIVEQAKLLAPGEKVVKLDGEEVAEWVEYSDEEFGPHDERDADLIKRVANNKPEMLVLIDRLNVTGEFLKSAAEREDARGGAAVELTFNDEGARRFHQLTSANVPDPGNPAVHSRLGIMFDKKVLTAPSIISPISNRAMLSGGAMTEREVELILAVLNAGSLPAPIVLVDEWRADGTK